MLKKIAIMEVSLSVVIIGIGLSIIFVTNENQPIDLLEEKTKPDVIMPTKSSRPGCEEDDSCYIPTKIRILTGESVTWLNEDAAFHSVTSGSTENPLGSFDSGHLDPGQLFTITFDEAGSFDYFCTLHPWMKGIVIVEDR